eukprot:1159892-Pelagomonas_calceolata.AAC.27
MFSSCCASLSLNFAVGWSVKRLVQNGQGVCRLRFSLGKVNTQCLRPSLAGCTNIRHCGHRKRNSCSMSKTGKSKQLVRLPATSNSILMSVILMKGHTLLKQPLCKSPWEAGLVDTDVGNADRLAQHSLQIPTHASNRIIPPFLCPQTFLRGLVYLQST